MLENSKCKKYYIFSIQSFFFIFNFYFFILPISNCQDYFDSLGCKYPRVYSMHNGNNIIACNNGIYVYNSNLKNRINYIPFNTEISDDKEAALITISQYPNNGNIIIITKNKFYFLSSEGQLKFDYDITINNEGQVEDYLTLVPYKYENNYNFLVGFINTDKYIDIIYYKIDDTQNKVEIINDYVADIKNEYNYRLKFNYGFDCQIMYTDSLGDLITCFHFDSNPNKIGVLSLHLNTNIEKIEDYCQIFPVDNSPKFLKSVISLDKSKALIALVDTSRYVNYILYDINLKEFSLENKYTTYFVDYPSCIQAQYFSQTHEYIFSFSDKVNFKIEKFDENMNSILNENNEFSLGSSRISFYNIILIPETKTYSIIMDTNTDNNKMTRFYNLPEVFSPEEIFPISFYSSAPNYESNPNTFSSLLSTNLQSTEYSIIFSSIISNTNSEIKTNIPSTIITNNPSTIAIIIPTSIITIIPSTILTTIPSTIIIKPPTSTLISTIPSTIITKTTSILISTIPSTIIITKPPTSTLISTIPSTIITKTTSTLISTIPSTIMTNIQTSIINSIPNTILTTFPSTFPSNVISTIIKSNLIETTSTTISTIFLEKESDIQTIASISSSSITKKITSSIPLNMQTSGLSSVLQFPSTSQIILESTDIFYSETVSVSNSLNNIYFTNPSSINSQSISSSNSYFSNIPNSFNSYISSSDKIDKNKSDNIISEICSFEYFFYNLKTKECERYCSSNEILNEICYINNITENNIMNITQVFQDLIHQLKLNESINVVINGNNAIYQIISSEAMKENINKNISIIDFGECEKTIKRIYSLDYIIILKIDISLSNSTNIVLKYELYNPNTLEKIDLSICNNMTINTYIPYSISKEDLELYKKLKQLGHDLYNPNDSFYHDLCIPYTTNKKTDILLLDRRIDYFKNITFCKEGCTYKQYDYLYGKVQCECLIEDKINKNIDNIKFYGTLLFSTFFKFENFSNIKVVTCFKLVFSKLGQINNFGSYLLIILTFIFLILMTLFCFSGKARISQIINSVVRNKQLRNVKAPIKKKIKDKNNNKIFKKKPKRMSNIIINKNIVINNHNYLGEKKTKINNSKYLSEKSNNKMLSINSLGNKKLKVLNSKLTNISNNKNKKINKSTKLLFKPKIKESKKIENKKKRNIFYNDFELNSLKYNDAIIYDKRTYLQYYCSLIRQKHMILFTFISKNDYNLLLNKLSLFIFSFSLYFTMNTLFFDNNTIHKIYETRGQLKFIYNILHIIYSMMISSFITIILKLLALSNNNILHLRKIKQKNINKAIKESNQIIKELNIKFNIYYFIGFILLTFFWYFISAFCAVYNNSQIILFENTFSSYALSLIYPFAINLLPGIFRISALRAKNKNKNCLYIFGNIISII